MNWLDPVALIKRGIKTQLRPLLTDLSNAIKHGDHISILHITNKLISLVDNL